MRFGVSTHLFHDRRLEPRAPGADRRRTASRPSSSSRRAATSTTTTGGDRPAGRVAGGDGTRARTACTRRSPTAVRGRRPAGRRRISNASSDNAQRGGGGARGGRRAEDRARGFRSTCWSCTSARRRAQGAGRQPPRRPQCGASRRSAALAAARGVRVALEVIPNQLSDAASLVDDARAGSRRAATPASASTSATRT